MVLRYRGRVQELWTKYVYLPRVFFANSLEGLRTIGAASNGKSLGRKRRCSRIRLQIPWPGHGEIKDVLLLLMGKGSLTTLANEQSITKLVSFEANN